MGSGRTAGDARDLRGSLHRGVLRASSFGAGAAVMTVELAGSRLLAPQFGNTLYNWAGLIGVVLAAMAGGAYLGGRLADARPPERVLTALLTVSGFLVLSVPALAGAVLPAMGVGALRWGPLVASLSLFAAPALALAGVAPVAVRGASPGGEGLGALVGGISAWSTAGSLAGTFLTTFLLVPAVGVRAIFLWTGLVLLGLALAVALVVDRRGPSRGRGKRPVGPGPGGRVAAGLLVAGLLVLWGRGTPPAGPGILLHEEDTPYHRIRVHRIGQGPREALLLHLDTTLEGGRYLRSPDLLLDYTEYVRLWPLFTPSLDSALFLGGGAYSMPLALAREVPHARVEVVEVDPAVQEVGHRFFGLPRAGTPRGAGQVVARLGDARQFLAASSDRYDLIFGDAYHGVQNIPFHLATREFFALVRDRLSERGVFLMNLIGAREGPRSGLFRAVARTLADAFGAVHVFQVGEGRPEEVSNLILVAQRSPQRLDPDEFRRRAEVAGLARLARGYRGTIEGKDAAAGHPPPLTDDHCPLETLIAGQLASGP